MRCEEAGFKQKLYQQCFLQVLLGAPFLIADPVSYLVGSFNLGRVFLFEWTVNWRFLPEEIFVHPAFHISLLFLHICLLALFANPWYRYGNTETLSKHLQVKLNCVLTYRFMTNFAKLQPTGVGIVSQLFLLPLFTANMIGIAVSRSLHYQFYVWYFHSLPYLLWSTSYSVWLRYIILLMKF